MGCCEARSMFSTRLNSSAKNTKRMNVVFNCLEASSCFMTKGDRIGLLLAKPKQILSLTSTMAVVDDIEYSK